MNTVAPVSYTHLDVYKRQQRDKGDSRDTQCNKFETVLVIIGILKMFVININVWMKFNF